MTLAFTYLKNVVTLELESNQCTGCRTCTAVCPHAVLAVEDGKARIVNRDACMECGACALNCPADALTVDKGVGCAYAVLKGMRGGTAACCGEVDSCCD